MDLIYTDADRADMGVLTAYAFDLSYGAKENDFEITMSLTEPALMRGAFIYIENTEYGGIVDGRGSYSGATTRTYYGRTWHGILNSKVVEPDSGEDYFTVSGDANAILTTLINRLGLSTLFTVPDELSAINIKKYQFHRYCKAYDGICDMLADNGGKLRIEWKDRNVCISAVPVIDYTDAPIDSDIAVLSVEKYDNKLNHLICLGAGDLKDRTVVHLYVDANGNIGDTQHYFGLDEIADTYDYAFAQSEDNLREEGIKKLKDLRGVDIAEMTMNREQEYLFDIGDIIGASEIETDNSVSAPVIQKIVKIENGAVSIEYQAGG